MEHIDKKQKIAKIKDDYLFLNVFFSDIYLKLYNLI